MKKIFILMLSVLSFLLSKNVLAKESKLVMEYVNNPYYYRDWGDSVDTGKLTFYNLDGEVAYCIEPGIHISDDTYIESSLDSVPLTRDQLEKIKLIGYYGFEYMGHDTVRYRMATQALIWENIRNLTTEFWSGKNKTGELIDVSLEKNEIMELVNNHYITPEFKEETTISIDTEVVFEDVNHVLKYYTVINNNKDIEVIKDNDKLYIKGNKEGDYSIILKKLKYDNKTTIFYVGKDGVSQKMMKLRIDDEVETSLNISILSGQLNLQKLDMETKTNKVVGNCSLENAKYGIYDENNNLIEVIKTNEFGEAKSSNLKFGNYYLQEIEPSYGYLLDNKKYNFIINEEQINVDLKVYESAKKKKFTIIKSLEDDSSFLSLESGVIFEIYLNKEDEVYGKVVTDINGIAEIDLPFGRYLIHQVNTLDGYYKVDDFEILINEDSNDIYKMLKDKKVIGKIEILKTDSSTNTSLSNAFIEVYKVDNEETFIKEGYTDKDGKLVIDNLDVGTYRIIEKASPDGYQVNNDEYYVTISNLQNEVFLNIKNDSIEVVEIEVPNTLIDSKNNKKLILILLLNGGFMIIYSIIKKDEKSS